MKELVFKLSKNELQILNTMWRENRELLRSEIIDLTEDKTWKESSIHILLNQLLKKGAIEIKGFKQNNTNIGRTYIPTISEDEYKLMQLNQKVKEMEPSSSLISNFVNSLVKNNKLNKDDLLELEEIIQENKDK